MITFKNLEEMQPFFDKESNTYNIYDDITITFDLSIMSNINTLNINAGDIKAWDIKATEAVEREHALLKIEVEDKRRAELLQLITAVQARIVDSSGSIWILEVTGDTSSVDNAFNLFMDFRILESIRTGKIALERGPSRVMKK